MVQMKRYILILLTCLSVQACSSSTMNEQRVQGGKISFMAGDFKSAFHQLLPLAAEGVPQAEYGVGYMYYYGYGVTQDTESGIFWMNKAAAAHYLPAIRALQAIQDNNLKNAIPHKSSESTKSTRVSYEKAQNPLEKDALVESMNKKSDVKQGHVTIMSEEDHSLDNVASSLKQSTVTAMAKPDQPLAELQSTQKTTDSTAPEATPPLPEKISENTSNSKKYTLQLLGSYYLSSLKERQAQMNLGTPTFIGQTKFNGRDWYVLTVGQYPALGNAELAKLDLPKKIKDYKPWIRKCDEIRWVG